MTPLDLPGPGGPIEGTGLVYMAFPDGRVAFWAEGSGGLDKYDMAALPALPEGGFFAATAGRDWPATPVEDVPAVPLPPSAALLAAALIALAAGRLLS